MTPKRPIYWHGLGATARRAASTVRRALANLGADEQPGRLLLVTGGGDWVVKQIAITLQHEFRSLYPDTEVLDFLRRRPSVTQAYVHCLCRPAFFGGRGIPELHQSNRLVVSWLHGGRGSGHSEMENACDQLERHWRRVQRFIVPNSTTRAHVLACGVDPSIVHTVPLGVNTSLFRPATTTAERMTARRALDIPLDACVIGSFQRDGDDNGNPKHVKGPDVLVNALAAIHAHSPVVALLTGSGRTYVQRELEARGVPFIYRWFDRPDDLVQCYHAIDTYLITSREEGGPAALGESMASGVPVVSTRMGLAADVMVHGTNGWLADVEDADGLAKGVLTLIERPHLRLQYATAALETIRPLDYRVIARRYHDEVYQLAFR